MNPTEVLRQQGYNFPAPIPRSPAVVLDDDIEDVPSPYYYSMMLAPHNEREAIRQKFIHDCNLKRFQHILRAEPPKRKNSHVSESSHHKGS